MINTNAEMKNPVISNTSSFKCKLIDSFNIKKYIIIVEKIKTGIIFDVNLKNKSLKLYIFKVSFNPKYAFNESIEAIGRG